MDKKQFSLAIVLALFCALMVYSVHFDYDFPIHTDEWHHLALSIQFNEQGLLFDNPYLNDWDHKNFEPGFHIFLAGLQNIPGFDPVLHYKFLPAISMFILSILMFLLMKEFGLLTAFLSLLFLANIRSNLNVYGPFYFVPLIMAFPLMIGCFLLFLKFEKSNDWKKYFPFIIICLVIICFVHPTTAIFTSIVLFLTFIFNFISRKMSSKQLILIPIILLVILFVKKPIIYLLSSIKPFFVSLISNDIVNRLIYDIAWGRGNYISYLNLDFFGIFPVIFGCIGLYIAFKARSVSKIFIVFPLVALFQMLIYHSYGMSILVPYQRAVYYFVLGLVPLSGIGLAGVVKPLQKSVDNVLSAFTTFSKEFSIGVLSITIILLFAVIFQGYHTPIFSKDFRVIDQKDYDSLIWMKKFGLNKMVLPEVNKASAIYPIVRGKVPGLVGAQLGGGSIEDVIGFFRVDCLSKARIIKKHGVDLVFSRAKFNCPFLISKRDDVYKVNEVKLEKFLISKEMSDSKQNL